MPAISELVCRLTVLAQCIRVLFKVERLAVMHFFDFPSLLRRLERYRGPVEIHVTVHLDNTEEEKVRFEMACKAQNGKCIWIELEDGQVKNQPMYGRRLPSSAPHQQAAEIYKLVEALSLEFSLMRIKVEASPHNEGIPQTNEAASTEPEDCYFEHHLALHLLPSVNVIELKKLAVSYDGYLSRNAFKSVTAAGEHIRFITQRFHNIGQPEADAKLDRLVGYLREVSIPIVDIEREYNIFDSNLDIDRGWIV